MIRGKYGIEILASIFTKQKLQQTALQLARQRLGARAVEVNWIEADITQADLPHQAYDVCMTVLYSTA